MKQLFIFDSKVVANGRPPSCKHFPILLDSKITFQTQKRSQKTLFQSACFIRNDRDSLWEIDQKIPLGWLIGYENSYLDSLLCYWKVFRLHAFPNDAAGANRPHTCKRPGSCYIWTRSKFLLLGHVTGLLFCLYKKIFVHSIFSSVDFWNRMSLIVLDIELTEKNIIEELGVFWRSLQRFPFFPQNFWAYSTDNMEHKPSTWDRVE